VWVQAVPSCWPDSFPTVALEAMMRGTALIGSDIGGLPESIRHNETGFLVRPGDENALAAALVLLLENKELAERMGKTGRDVAVAHFSESACVDKFIALYESLV